MKTDLYTKIILTVIAVALTVIVLRNCNIVSVAHAASPTGIGPATDVNIVSFNGQRVYVDSNGALCVSVKNTPEVNVATKFSNPLEVKVVNAPKVEISSGYSGLDVNVKNYRDFK